MGDWGPIGGFEWWRAHDRVLRGIGACTVSSYVIAPARCALAIACDGSPSTRDVDAVVAVAVAFALVVAVASAAELRVLEPALGSFAIARGMPAPAMWMTDDDAPNAFVFGRAGAPNVCMTRGALALASDALAALCAYDLTA